MGINKKMINSNELIRCRLFRIAMDDTVAISIIAMVSLMISLKILTSGGLIIYGDLAFPISLEKYIDSFGVWNSNISFSIGYVTRMMLMYMAPFLSITLFLRLPIEVLAKMMIVTALFLTGFSMYYATKIILKVFCKMKGRPVLFASITSGVVYMFNTWSMDRIGHYFFWTGYALAPLVLVFSMKITQTTKLDYKLVFFTVFLLSLASTSPHSILLNIILVFSWFLYSIILSLREQCPSKVLSHIKAGLLIVILFVILNAHWIIPYAFSSLVRIPRPQYIVTWETIERLSARSDLLNVIRLMGNWFPQVVYQPPPPLYTLWLPASFTLPLAAFVTALTKFKDKYVKYFLLMCVLSIFLAMGSNSPLSQAYKWASLEAPFSDAIGWVFREPDRWNGLTSLMYALLIGIAIPDLFQRNWIKYVPRIKALSINWKSMSYLLPLMLATLLISSFTLYAAPTISAYFHNIYVPVKVPQEYYDVNDWLRNQSGVFRVLWLAPWKYGMPVNGTIRHTWAPEKAVTLRAIEVWSSAKPSMASRVPFSSYEARRYINFIYSRLQSDDLSKYVELLGVRYIVYHNDILGAEKKGELELQKLMKQPNLKLVWQSGFMYIFESNHYAPRVYAPHQSVLVVGNLDSLSEFTSVNGSKLSNNAIIFLQQSHYEPKVLNTVDHILLIDKDLEDLALSFVSNKYLIRPFDHTITGNPFKGWAKTNIYEDRWNWPDQSIVGYWDWDYGYGLIKTATPSAKLNMPFNAEFAGSHELWMRYLTRAGKMAVYFDDVEVGEVEAVGEGGFKWIRVGAINVTAGRHTVTLESLSDYNAVNLIAVAPTYEVAKLFNMIEGLNVHFNDEGLSDIFSRADSDRSTVASYEQVSPTKWLVHVNTSEPFVLAFTESYDPLWIVHGDGFFVRSFPLYSVINGFHINKTGTYELVIEYEPQKFFDLGLYISAVSVATISVLCVILSHKRFEVRENAILRRTTHQEVIL
ncbi:MAG: hypothetical protein OEZ25_02800 [Candidatus Bathyarchaeota archaeon]|nr:hypothetical protein [Candidatus Bathyarchaeota archaeon]